jgi:hypothetical protein
MPVRVKNSTTGSDSGKKPVCVCASAPRLLAGKVVHTRLKLLIFTPNKNEILWDLNILGHEAEDGSGGCCRHRFDPGSFLLGFIVYKAALGQGFLLVIRFSAVSSIPPMLHTHSSTTDAVDSHEMTASSNNILLSCLVSDSVWFHTLIRNPAAQTDVSCDSARCHQYNVGTVPQITVRPLHLLSFPIYYPVIIV